MNVMEELKVVGVNELKHQIGVNAKVVKVLFGASIFFILVGAATKSEIASFAVITLLFGFIAWINLVFTRKMFARAEKALAEAEAKKAEKKAKKASQKDHVFINKAKKEEEK